MLGRHDQPRLGVEAAFTVEQCLQAGTLTVSQHSADDRGRLCGGIGGLGHATADDHCLGAGVDGPAGLGDGRGLTERGHRLALVGDQHQVVVLGRGTCTFGKGVDQANDRGGRQRDIARTCVNERYGNAVKESSHGNAPESTRPRQCAARTQKKPHSGLGVTVMLGGLGGVADALDTGVNGFNRHVSNCLDGVMAGYLEHVLLAFQA